MAVDVQARPAAPSARTWVAGETTTPFVLLAVTSGALLLLGLVMSFSASFVLSTAETGDAFGLFAKQLAVCLLGVPGLVVAAALDYRRWRRYAGPLLWVALALSALVLVPSLGTSVNGARRWFDLGPVSVQPSEIVKLALPLWLASVTARRWSRVRAGDVHALLMPALPVIALAAGLVLAGPDLETAGLVVATGVAVLYVAGLPVRLLAGAGAVTMALGAVGIVTSDYRRGRVLAWLDPASHPVYGYQNLQGYIALGSGGLFGVGLGRSRGKWLYVPNAHTDFIFAIIGEELGLLGAVAVLGLFSALVLGGVLAASRAPDAFGRLLAAALTTGLLLQAAVNIGSVVGLLPVTGVTLPLVSFGGSSLLVTMAAIGLLLSIARAGRPRPARPNPTASHASGTASTASHGSGTASRPASEVHP